MEIVLQKRWEIEAGRWMRDAGCGKLEALM